MTRRILWNQRGGCIDEIVIDNAAVHIEQMSDSCWWIGIDLPDGTYWAGNFHTRRAPIQFTEQESNVAWDRDDTHEQEGT